MTDIIQDAKSTEPVNAMAVEFWTPAITNAAAEARANTAAEARANTAVLPDQCSFAYP